MAFFLKNSDMTRNELYNQITPCGTIPYTGMLYLLNSLIFTDAQVKLGLIERLTQNGRISQEDWRLLARTVEFTPGSPIDGSIVEGWIGTKCSLSRSEFKLFLEFTEFTDGSTPTYLISEVGDFILPEN